MYGPAHFAAEDAEVRELLRHHGAADLVTAAASGLTATLLPLCTTRRSVSTALCSATWLAATTSGASR